VELRDVIPVRRSSRQRPPDLRLIQPLKDIQRVLHKTTLSLVRERMHPRRVTLGALCLQIECEGAVEEVRDERHCELPRLVRRVRRRLEQLSIRTEIGSRPQDLWNDAPELYDTKMGFGLFLRHMWVYNASTTYRNDVTSVLATITARCVGKSKTLLRPRRCTAASMTSKARPFF
jgi:hypothetical protein